MCAGVDAQPGPASNSSTAMPASWTSACPTRFPFMIRASARSTAPKTAPRKSISATVSREMIHGATRDAPAGVTATGSSCAFDMRASCDGGLTG
jgi:hypothetical protein